MAPREIYTNPNCRRIRGSHILEVRCAHCQCFIANYQKVGESNFVKMYNDRIIDGSILAISRGFVLPGLRRAHRNALRYEDGQEGGVSVGAVCV